MNKHKYNQNSVQLQMHVFDFLIFEIRYYFLIFLSTLNKLIIY